MSIFTTWACFWAGSPDTRLTFQAVSLLNINMRPSRLPQVLTNKLGDAAQFLYQVVLRREQNSER